MKQQLYRAARAALGWSQGELATAAGLALTTLRNLEAGKQARTNSLVDLEVTLKGLGLRLEDRGDELVLRIPAGLKAKAPKDTKTPPRKPRLHGEKH